MRNSSSSPVWLIIFLVGCGSGSAASDARPNNTDANISFDAGRIDAAPGPRTSEITSGGARISGATYQVDVQLGHATGQQPMTGNGKTIEAATAIKP